MAEAESRSGTDAKSVGEVAQALFMEGRYQEANLRLLDLARGGSETSFLCFCIGRNYLYDGNLIDAELWLEKSVRFTPPFMWSHYELGRLHEAKGDLAQAASAFADFLDTVRSQAGGLKLSEAHANVIASVAHRCFEEGRSSDRRLYAAMVAAGIRDYLAELRVAERLVDEGRLDEAEAALESVASRHDLDPWGLLVVGRLRFVQGDAPSASSMVLAALAKAPGDAVFAVAAGNHLVDFGLASSARTVLKDFVLPLTERDPVLEQRGVELAFRIDLLTGHYEKLLAFCQKPGCLDRLPDRLAAEALRTLAELDDDEPASRASFTRAIANRLRAQDPPSLEAVLALFDFYHARRRWGEIEDLEQAISQTPLFTQRDVALKRLENLCARSKIREALELYDEYYDGKTLLQWEACAVLRLMAEAGRWEEAGRILQDFVRDGHTFPDGDYFLLKIVRRAGIHKRVLAVLDDCSRATEPAQFAILREMIADDLAIKVHTPGGAASGSGQPALSRRNWFLYSARDLRQPRTVAAYLCTDRAYFLSVLTFLVSMVAQGGAGPKVAWHVFLAKDVPSRWRGALALLGAKIGLDIQTVPENAFVEADAVHAETYGLFTGGNVLSRAAYLRIYAARYLLKKGAAGRAFYFDSDMVVNGDVSGLIEASFDDAFLMARAEENSIDVRSAAAKHGIEPASYFNSGVLGFDFSKPEIIDPINAAVALSETEPERLMFHDQCALNIAFAGKVQYIEPIYNHFLRPNRPDNGAFSKAALLHFLERPKPWDISYRREYRALWSPHAAMVRALLDPEDYNAMVAAANR